MSKMKQPTMEQIDNYLSNIENSFDLPICENLSINIKTSLSEAEKKSFVDRVIKNSYVNNITYSSVENRYTFVVTFIQMLTNFPVPVIEDDPDIVDIEKLCDTVTKLKLMDIVNVNPELSKLIDELKMCIKEEIDFKNQKIFAMYAASSASNDAIESFNFMVHKGIDLIDLIMTQVEKNGSKLLKNLGSKKFDVFLNDIKAKLIDTKDIDENVVDLAKVKQKEDN